MKKENIHTDQAPAAIGPYVQAVRVGDLIYTAGQAGLDPATGSMVEGDAQAQAEQTMKNLGAVLKAAGSDFDHVVKTNIYLRYMMDFSAVNEVYASFFNGQFPARTTIAASALPLTALVEIEMVALAIEEKQEKKPKSEKKSTAKKEKKAKKGKK